jgi:hypothetical protein
MNDTNDLLMEQEPQNTLQGKREDGKKDDPSKKAQSASVEYTSAHVGHFLKNLRDLLEVLLFYIALPITTLYPMAVLFYWAQIRTSYDTDFEASWHAALLIPKNFAVVEIVKDLTLGASSTLLIVYIVALTVFFLEKEGEETSLERHNRTLSKLPKRDHVRDIVRVLAPFLAVCAAIGISAYIVVFANFPFTDNIVGEWRRSVADEWVDGVRASLRLLSVAVGWVVGFLTARLYERSRHYARDQDTFDKSRGPLIVRRWLLPGALVAYGASVILTITWGLFLHPQLPKVVFVGADSNIESGLLLGDPSVAGGYWDILDADGHVVAIPSGQATYVKVVRSTNAP